VGNKTKLPVRRS